MEFQDFKEMDQFNMHAVTCIPPLLGSMEMSKAEENHSTNNADIYKINKHAIEGLSFKNHKVRSLDQSRSGPILHNEVSSFQRVVRRVKALFIQNTNPLVVAPEAIKVKKRI